MIIMWTRIKKYGWIIVGTLLMALAVKIVYEPMNMVTGGVSGIGIILRKITENYIPGGIPVWLTNLALNIPIFIWGYFVKGKSFLRYTFLANLFFSFFLMILPVVTIPEKDYVLSALLGGGLNGAGLGCVFLTGNSTGGTDLLSSILQKYFRHYSVAQILFFLDTLIILSGVVVFGVSCGAYAVIAVFLSSKIMDGILSGLKVGKQVWIISEHYREISQSIMRELHRGVTCLEGTGMYSEKTKKVLLCVAGKREIVKIVDLVAQIDPGAFVIIQDAREVMGEGFQEII